MAGLHPKNPKDVFKGEIWFETLIKEGSGMWGSNLPKEDPARAEKMTTLKELWPKMCKNFEKYITEDKKFIAGDTMTTHDYTVGIMLINVFKNPTKEDQDFWAELWKEAPERMTKYVDDIQGEIRGYLGSDKRQEKRF